MMEFDFTEEEKREILSRFKSGSHPKRIARDLSTTNMPTSELDVLDIIRENLKDD